MDVVAEIARMPRADKTLAGGSSSNASKGMDLKGEGSLSTIGRCVSVLYDEGGADLVAYRGVVVYLEHSRRVVRPKKIVVPYPQAPPPHHHATSQGYQQFYPQDLAYLQPILLIHSPALLCLFCCRMYVHFDEFDETEGAWVDDTDEWQWVATPRTGVPPPLPVAGAWRPGLMPGAIEKIFLAKVSDQPPPENLPPGSQWIPPTLLLVKWKDLAHIHSQWVAQGVLELDQSNKQRIQRFFKAQAAEAAGSGITATWEIEGDGTGTGGGPSEDEPYNPDFEVVERVRANPKHGPCPACNTSASRDAYASRCSHRASPSLTSHLSDGLNNLSPTLSRHCPLPSPSHIHTPAPPLVPRSSVCSRRRISRQNTSSSGVAFPTPTSHGRAAARCSPTNRPSAVTSSSSSCRLPSSGSSSPRALARPR